VRKWLGYGVDQRSRTRLPLSLGLKARALRAFYTKVAPLGAAFVALWLASCRDDLPAPDSPPRALPDAGTTPREAAAPPPDLPGVKVASFNVRRLFDTTCDTGDCGPGAYEEAPSAQRFSEKVSELAVAITRLRANIVFLQEVETRGCLDALKAQLPSLPNAYLAETDLPASVDVGILSAYPIAELRSHRGTAIPLPNGEPTTFTRDLLEAHITAPEGEIIAFVAHFRSKVNDDPDRRLAEARAARRIVLEAAARSPKAIVLLGGDLNDVPGSPPLEALGEGGALVRVSEGLPNLDIGTIRYDGGLLAIDHFFLVRASAGMAVPGSFQVFREESTGWGGSDHGAIRANFTRR